MTNRVLIDANSFKVSKAGYDVLTANDLQLLFNSDTISFKKLQTGNQAVLSENTLNVYFTHYTSPYPDPGTVYYPFFGYTFFTTPLEVFNTSGYVPYVSVQRKDGTEAWGGGYYHEYLVTGYWIQYTNPITGAPNGPPQFVTNTTPTFYTKGLHGYPRLFDGYFENGNTGLYLHSWEQSAQMYYAAFTVPLSGTGGGTPPATDITVDALSYSNVISGTSQATSSSQNLTVTPQEGVPTLRMTVSPAPLASTNVSAVVNDTAYTVTNGTTTVDFTVNHNDTLSFFLENTDEQPDTTHSISVTNLSDNNAAVTSLSMEVYNNYVPPAFTWTTASNNGYTETDTVAMPTVSGSSRTLNLDNAVSGAEYVMAFVNGIAFGPFRSTSQVSFTASTGDSVKFGFYTDNSYTTGGTVVGAGDISSVSMTNSNLVPTNIISYNNISNNSTNNFAFATTTTQSFNNISGTRTFKVILTGSGDGITLNSSGATSDGSIPGNTSGQLNFTADSNDSVLFNASLIGNFQNYFGIAKVYIVANGYDVYLDQFTISLSTQGSGGPLE
jgi:hypothetical protein